MLGHKTASVKAFSTACRRRPRDLKPLPFVPMKSPALPQTGADALHSTGRSVMRLLYGCVLCVATLLAYEIAHYIRATDFGNLDDFAVAWVGYHPQCTPAASGALDLVCPLAGYNSVALHCWTSSCNYRDPNDLPLTEAMRKTRERQFNEDERNSRNVEPPLPTADKKAILAEDDQPLLPPQTMPGALEYMHRRDLLQWRQVLKRLEPR